MGWLRDEAPGHEGFVVAYVNRDGCDDGSLLVRELLYPSDATGRSDIQAISAGCECGWRSSHRLRTSRSDWHWFPYTAAVSDADEGWACALWSAHVKADAR